MKQFKKNIYCTIYEYINPCPDCVDHDVIIGDQTWTGCNANISTYRDGTIIPQVTDPTAWAALTTGAWCYYNNDPANGSTYGKIYNWYALMGIYDAASLSDPLLRKEFAPVGYKVPDFTDWNTLITFLGGSTIAGGKLKETGLCHWITPNSSATNISGFTGLPGGARSGVTGQFNLLFNEGLWLGSSLDINSDSLFIRTVYNSATANINYGPKRNGYSVRFIKDEVTCPDVTIGTQTWTSCNLNVDTYRNGDPIPQVTDATTWENLTTGAWCYYNNSSANGTVYGKLYNKYAVDDPRGLAPLGYHIPTDTEWNTLITYLGGTSVAGGKMKETGTLHWQSPNTGATNISGFTALGSGFRGAAGGFGLINQSVTFRNTVNANSLVYTTQTVVSAVNTSSYGYSVRLIKD